MGCAGSCSLSSCSSWVQQQSWKVARNSKTKAWATGLCICCRRTPRASATDSTIDSISPSEVQVSCTSGQSPLSADMASSGSDWAAGWARQEAVYGQESEVRSPAPFSRPSGRADSRRGPGGVSLEDSSPPPRLYAVVLGLEPGKRGGEGRRGELR